MSLRIVILGSSAAVPSTKRNLPSVAIKYFGNVYLFDCGEGTQRQMMLYGISYSKVKAVFITHLHADHYLGLAGLIHTLKFSDRIDKLCIFGPAGIKGKIQNLFQMLPQFVEITEIDDNFIYPESIFTIRPIKVEHSVNSFGYVFEENKKRNFDKEKANKLGIFGKTFGMLEKNGTVKINGKTIKIEDVSVVKSGKKIVYTGDTAYCENIVKNSVGADLLIHEATFDNELKQEAEEKKHSTAADAATTAKKAKVKNLLLTHISNRYKDDSVILNQAKKIFKNSQVAYDGMEIIL